MTEYGYICIQYNYTEFKIRLIGHSEGGAVISIAASQSKNVAFIISLANLATEGLPSVIRQNEDIVAAANIPDYDKKRYNEINNLMFHVAYKYADSDSLEQKLNETYQTWKVKGDAYFKSPNVGEYDHFRFLIYSYVRQAIGPWYRFFIRYNPEIYLSKVKVPVLALNGDKDIMVAADQKRDNFKRYLAENKDVTTILMPGINHLFLPCKTGKQKEYASLKGPISQEALEIIYHWIKKRI